MYHSESYLQDKIRKTLTWYLPDKLDHSRACTFVEFQIKLAKPELKISLGIALWNVEGSVKLVATLLIAV